MTKKNWAAYFSVLHTLCVLCYDDSNDDRKYDDAKNDGNDDGSAIKQYYSN